MKVQVEWATDGCSVEELGLPTIADIPTLNEESIADYLSDVYGYLVESFSIVDLDSGVWDGNDAVILQVDEQQMVILVGGYALNEALQVKGLLDNDLDLGDYDDNVVWTNTNEWAEEQEY